MALYSLTFAALLLAGTVKSDPAVKAPRLLVLRGTSIDFMSEFSVYLKPNGKVRARRCEAAEGLGFCKEPWKTKERRLSAAELAALSRMAKGADLFGGQATGLELDFNFRSLEVHGNPEVAILVTTLNESFSRGPRKDLLTKLMAMEDELAK